MLTTTRKRRTSVNADTVQGTASKVDIQEASGVVNQATFQPGTKPVSNPASDTVKDRANDNLKDAKNRGIAGTLPA